MAKFKNFNQNKSYFPGLNWGYFQSADALVLPSEVNITQLNQIQDFPNWAELRDIIFKGA